MADVLLIDLSSIAYPIWHMSQSEPDPNAASTQIVARVRADGIDVSPTEARSEVLALIAYMQKLGTAVSLDLQRSLAGGD